MALLMVDMRCPQCDRPVDGCKDINRNDVLLIKTIPHIERCAWCGCELEEKSIKDDLGLHYYYGTKNLIIPADGYADGGEPYTDEEMKLIESRTCAVCGGTMNLGHCIHCDRP